MTSKDIDDVVQSNIDDMINLHNSDYGSYTDVPDCYSDLSDLFDVSDIFGF